MLLLGFHDTPVVDHDACLFASRITPGDGEEGSAVRGMGEPYVLGSPERTGLLAGDGEVLSGDGELCEFGFALGHDSLFGSLTAPASVQCACIENGRGFV